MQNDKDTNLAQKQEEIELLKVVYPDLVNILSPNRIQVKLASDIEVIFQLPAGYPTRLINHSIKFNHFLSLFSASPKHHITLPAYLNEVRERINNKLKETYELCAGFQVLVSCIAEINTIANNCQSTSLNDSGILEGKEFCEVC